MIKGEVRMSKKNKSKLKTKDAQFDNTSDNTSQYYDTYYARAKEATRETREKILNTGEYVKDLKKKRSME